MKGKIWLLLAIIFLSGAATGFFSRQFFDRQRLERLRRNMAPHVEDWMVGRLTERLALRPDQVPLVREEVRELAGEIVLRRSEHRKDIQTLVDQMMAVIRPLVDERQRQILDNLTADDLTSPRMHRARGGISGPRDLSRSGSRREEGADPIHRSDPPL